MLRSARDWLTHEHSLFKDLNLEPILIGKGKATFAVDLPDAFCDRDGRIHGGLYTIIMDSIFGLSVFTALEEIKPIATINLRSDYLETANAGDRVICACECVNVRGDIAYVSGDLRDNKSGVRLAAGSGAFMVGTRGPAKGSRL